MWLVRCGGCRHDSVCNRSAVRCSWIEVGRLLVLGGRSDSREVDERALMSQSMWSVRVLRGRDDTFRDILPLAVFWMRD